MSEITKQVKLKNLADQLGAVKTRAFVVTFGSKSGVKHKFTDIQQALVDAELDVTVAKAFLPQHAFSRACKDMEHHRLIEVLRNEKDKITFQFTKRDIRQDELGEEELKYYKETKVTLDKITGDIKCKNDSIREQAQRELDKHMEERNTSDVTKMVQALFNQNADLMPLPGAIGVYVVLKEHISFLSKIRVFLESLGRKPHCLPIPEGTDIGDKSIQETVEGYLDTLIEDYNDLIEGFSISTRQSTLDEQTKKLRDTKTKIQAYATYLGDRVEKLNSRVESGEVKLINKVKSLSEERLTAPQTTKNGVDRFGCRLGGDPSKINAVLNGIPKPISQISSECGLSEGRVKSHLEFWAKKGCFEKVGVAWRVSPNYGVVSSNIPISEEVVVAEPF